ncbi:transcriptional regulator, TetR family [Lachnospiraceae bacterium KM106-2]|nr:transcriptional regulator, TetR family [Lachnospiraceae bacterium KM106-2]
MRISKDPEVRKQEILAAAMELFDEKGYEATTMTDIAKRVGVVSGLCYRYFKSKHELYETAIQSYVTECSAEMIKVLTRDEENLEVYFKLLENSFLKSDGKEMYHDFFHKKGNEMFNAQMSCAMCDHVGPYMEQFLERMQEKGMIKVTDCRAASGFLLYGQIPILNDESLSSEEKVERVIELIKKVIY